MGLVSYSFIINGTLVDPPRDWMDVDIIATFDNRAQQANISTEQFSFVNNGAKLLIDYVEAGKTGGRGIFEGLPIQITANDSGNSLTVFEGFMDFDRYEQIASNEVKCAVKKLNGLNQFSDRIEATTYSYLFSKGVFSQSDFVKVPYLVEKDVNPLQLVMLTVTLYQMIREGIDGVKRIVEGITYIVKAANPDIAPPAAVPNVGQIVSAIVLVIIDILVTVLIIVAIVNLMIQIIELLIGPVRFHRATYERTLLENAVNFLGYKFVSPIEELDQIVYLPSAPTKNEPILIGLPKAADFGYRVSEMFEIMHKKYNAKTAIIGDEVHLRSLNDPFWKKTSTYVLRDVLDEGRKYNTVDLKANRLIRFNTDVSDEHTVDNFKGTVYEVITEPISTTNEEMVLIKGLDDISLPVALGTRKETLNDVEQFIKPILGFVDGLINAFGGNSSLAKLIDQRVGMLKISDRIYYTAKLIPFVNGSIPKNYRDILGAKAMYVKYINERSFVANGFSRQRAVKENIKIPFSLSDFIKLEKNSFFATSNGGEGEAIKFVWRLASDFAMADYEIEEIYTTNLREITVEPE